MAASSPCTETVPPVKYEYLDHPADVQLHAWGDSLGEAFEQVAMSMFGYMTEIDSVEMHMEETIEAEGEDLLGLVYHFLDEWLYVFSAENFFIPRKIKITEFDQENFKIKATGYGEPFQIGKHPQGTEVKAITYSSMKVHDHETSEDGKDHILVIIDI